MDFDYEESVKKRIMKKADELAEILLEVSSEDGYVEWAYYTEVTDSFLDAGLKLIVVNTSKGF